MIFQVFIGSSMQPQGTEPTFRKYQDRDRILELEISTSTVWPSASLWAPARPRESGGNHPGRRFEAISPWENSSFC